MEDVKPKSPALRRETPKVRLYTSVHEGVASLGPKAIEILLSVKTSLPFLNSNSNGR